MLDTLSREQTRERALFEAPDQHQVVVHRPGAPRPVLRPLVCTAAPSSLPPSERRPVAVEPQSQPTRLRLTRRGRLTLLVGCFLLLFVAFSVGHTTSNAATSAPTSGTHTVVVAPGDTAWKIASDAWPHLDPREAVDRLLSLNHSDGVIQVGQTLLVPNS